MRHKYFALKTITVSVFVYLEDCDYISAIFCHIQLQVLIPCPSQFATYTERELMVKRWYAGKTTEEETCVHVCEKIRELV